MPEDLFLKNMAALWRTDARLAFVLDELPLDARLQTESSRAGPATAAAVAPDGRRLYLHSRYDPAAEAASLCRTLDEREAATQVVVLSGLGLGHHVAPLRARLGPEGVIVVSEPDVVTIKTALEQTDLAAEIAGGRLLLVHRLDKADLHAKLDRHSGSLMLGTRFLALPHTRQIEADFHQQVRTAITDFAAFAKMSLLTLVANARITCVNIANNLGPYVATPPIDALRGRFAGYPAVLVAAGPSLGRNVDQLAGAIDRAVIVAMQTTLKPLRSRGIRPDFVTSLDFSDLSKRFFEDVDLDGVHLVAEPKASWQVIDTFMGGPPNAPHRPPRSLGMLYNDFAHRCLGDPLGARGGLQAGATVAHLAFYLAQYLGCDPIILVGQDLGYSGGVYYTPGVAIHDMWQAELGTFGTLEMKEWERIARARPILIRTKDVHGRSIYTDEQLFTYLQQFERDFAVSAARIIDATQGGVRKAGTTPMPLADALAQFATRTIPHALRAELASAPFDASKLAGARTALHKRLDELSEFRDLCRETRDLIVEMGDFVEKPLEFNRRIVRIDELRVLVQERGVIFRMVSDVSQLAEWQKFSADRKLTVDTRPDVATSLSAGQRARRQLERDRRFVDALLEGSDVLERMLRDALKRLEVQ